MVLFEHATAYAGDDIHLIFKAQELWGSPACFLVGI